MKKIKLLIVDGNDEFVESVCDSFADDRDVEIVAKCGNGNTALDYIRDLTPDIVLMDLILAETDGFGVLEEVGNITDDMPLFIVVSQLRGDAVISRSLGSGASYFMAKPVNLAVLKDRIKEFGANSRDRNVKASRPMMRFSGRQEKTVDEKLANIFITVGIPAHIKGYQFLREGVKMSIEHPEIINSITKKLYPGIAEKFHTTPSKVERAIRHAIEVAWNRGKIENINTIFGVKVYSSNDKPTNGEFIALLADKMIMEGA